MRLLACNVALRPGLLVRVHVPATADHPSSLLQLSTVASPCLPCWMEHACAAPSQICAAKGKQVAVIMDLQGPEIRTSFLLDKAKGARVSHLELMVSFSAPGRADRS